MNIDLKAFAGNFSAANALGQEPDDEPIAEEDLMENARVTYEVFVQNNLDATSHSLQWLPNCTE
jgi:hypothetical protein